MENIEVEILKIQKVRDQAAYDFLIEKNEVTDFAIREDEIIITLNFKDKNFSFIRGLFSECLSFNLKYQNGRFRFLRDHVKDLITKTT